MASFDRLLGRRNLTFHDKIATVITLLGVTALLWLLLLFLFRIVNIFDAYLMTFPGPWVVFGAMGCCPLVLNQAYAER